MRKLLICALALGGFAASAQAADLGLDSLKDPLPDTLTYKGVTIYGTIDVGYGYQSEGLPANGSFYPTYNYLINKSANGSISGLQNNGLSQSQIGVKVEENIGMGFAAIAKLDTGFDPMYGELSDVCKSLLQSKQGGTLSANADGSRCGQAFNGNAYAGLTNSAYGTLTVGRQNSLMLDGVANYDPLQGSYAFSLIGYSGGAAAGVGTTETARWDNSVKYVYQYGPAHAAVQYAAGANDSSIFGHAIAGNIGATYKGLSVDGYYTNENAVVNAGADTSTLLKGVITNNEAYSAMAKYTFNLNGGLFGYYGGFKDEGEGAKLTLFAGYMHTDMTTPNQTEYNGLDTIGGYEIATSNGNRWVGTKTVQTEWGGATYAVGPWAFTGAYYHEGVSAYTGTAAGNINWASGVVDYTFNKHFDVYAGVSYSAVDGGQAAGFLHDNTTNAVTGLRLKF